MKICYKTGPAALFLFLLMAPLLAKAGDIAPFVGSYVGTAEVAGEGAANRRDMSVVVRQVKSGFSVQWTSVTYKSDGRRKEKSYTIGFTPTERNNIFASAMKTNVFGKAVPLDPLRGEPFVWARIDGKTLTVFSLFINEVGDYDMQEYHRTLVDGGLDLEFRSLRNGIEQKTIRTFLERKS